MAAINKIGIVLLGLLVVPAINAIIYDNGVSYDQAINEKQQMPVFGATSSRRYIVHKRNNNKVKADAASHGGKVVAELKSFTILSFSNATGAASFASMGYVIEEDMKRYPMSAVAPERNLLKNHGQQNPLSAQAVPWGVEKVFNGVLPTSDYYPSPTNLTKKLCIIDSGVWSNHPDLKGSSFTAADPNQAGNIQSACSHGTHVAGTVVANNNDFGVIGVFPGAPVMVVKVFNGSDCGWTYSSNLIKAADYCIDSGASVISMSLGGPDYSSAENSAFQAYKNIGVLSVAAAGNGGSSSYSYPASYTSVVSVGATDQNNNIASFSQFNGEVDIAAPGVGVLSTVLTEKIFFGTAGDQDILLQKMSNSASPTTNILQKLCLCSFSACPSNCTGGVCIIPRGGSVSYEAKGLACQASKGIAAIIYNDAFGFFSGALSSLSSVTIPLFETSDSYGAVLVSAHNAGKDVFVDSVGKPYDFYAGTSMATPHVSGTIFLLWNKFSACASTDILNAVLTTALDLGASGIDNYFGFGLIQYWAAAKYLQQPGRCGAGPTAPVQVFATPAPSSSAQTMRSSQVTNAPVVTPSSPVISLPVTTSSPAIQNAPIKNAPVTNKPVVGTSSPVKNGSLVTSSLFFSSATILVQKQHSVFG